MSKNKKELAKPERLNKKMYEEELVKLQAELAKLHYWIKEKGLKVVIIFEGVSSNALPKV